MLEQCFTKNVAFSGTVAGAPALGPLTSREAVMEFYGAALSAPALCNLAA
jgi:hypothetical protein